MAQSMTSETRTRDTREGRAEPTHGQAYAAGFGLYPWEPRSFARDRHDPLRNLEEDIENG